MVSTGKPSGNWPRRLPLSLPGLIIDRVCVQLIATYLHLDVLGKYYKYKKHNRAIFWCVHQLSGRCEISSFVLLAVSPRVVYHGVRTQARAGKTGSHRRGLRRACTFCLASLQSVWDTPGHWYVQIVVVMDMIWCDTCQDLYVFDYLETSKEKFSSLLKLFTQYSDQEPLHRSFVDISFSCIFRWG